MNRISGKLIILLIVSSLVPLVLFGIVAVWTARETARQIVAEKNLQVAKRAADQIRQYVDNSNDILKSLAQNLGKTNLLLWQKEQIIRNHAVQFEQFHSIELIDKSGRIVATSDLSGPTKDSSNDEAIKTVLSGRNYHSEVFISKNFVPSMIVGIPVKILGEFEGGLLGELNLIEMWNLVDSIRIGQEGYALVVTKNGFLIAHGLGSGKEQVLRQEKIAYYSLVDLTSEGKSEARIHVDESGVEKIGVTVPILGLDWFLVIEQPTREAYAEATHLTFQLTFLIGTFLFLMVLIGAVGGRRYIIAPIRELMRATRAVGSGNLSEKVKILTHDEFKELGDSFNIMTQRLSIFQEEIRRNERAALLGRIAGGMVHDLKHPVSNLENAMRLISRNPDDTKIRDVFGGIVKRELANLNRFLDDLLHLARPTPIKPISLSLSGLVKDLLECFQGHPDCAIVDSLKTHLDTTEGKKVQICVDIDPPDLKVWADRFALERILRNLIVNAIEAMPQGGRVIITARAATSMQSPKNITEISVSDTGPGIPPDQLRNLFEDYTTTKHKGIGLGLAICKKIVEEHKAIIEVQSQPGQGTMVILRFLSSNHGAG